MVHRLRVAYPGFLSTKPLARVSPSPKSRVDDLHQSEVSKSLDRVLPGRHSGAVYYIVILP